MSENHWAVFALRDIQSAIDPERYEVAAYHIEDAIEAILARDQQDANDAVSLTDQRDLPR